MGQNRLRLDSDKPSGKALKLLEFMLNNIKGQDKAVKDLVDAVEIFESELFTENKPIYVGLCCGPSGVGKTLTAELLAEFWFGNRNAFTKIACEAYSEGHSVSKLIGSPAGYIGHWNPNDQENSGTSPILCQRNIDRFTLETDSGNRSIQEEMNFVFNNFMRLQLDFGEEFISIAELFDKNGNILVKDLPKVCGKIRDAFPLIERYKAFVAKFEELRMAAAFQEIRKPKSIILFDEIEKADVTLHNILLNIIDKAELQLANGMMTNFSNSVILMTTNVGSRAIANILNPKKEIGFATEKGSVKVSKIRDEQIYRETVKELERVFPPEFLARLDRISVYRPLSKETLRSIMDVELRMFQEKVLKNLPIILYFDEGVREYLLREATDKPQNGARLIKNKIYRYLRKPLCRMKNRDELKAGDILYITLETADGKSCIVFEKEETPKEEKPKEESQDK